MYTEYYGLREIPFGLTPNLKFVFRTESFLEMLYNIRYGINQTKGLVVVTGEAGTGKTTTLRSAIQQFNREVLAVYIFNPFLTVADFYDQMITGLGIEANQALTKSAILNAMGRLLRTRHAHNLRTALIVDEAHGLQPELLEEIRLLLNYETGAEKLLQIILCGQPELHQTLNQPNLRQLKQRISLRCTLRAMTGYEVSRYIRYRLRIAGAARVNLFDRAATEMITRLSQGIPRIINNLCDNALLFGFAGGQKVISQEVIEEVAQNLDLALASSIQADHERAGTIL
jgi:type II secretory pathway predicted ATPase ExeA